MFLLTVWRAGPDFQSDGGRELKQAGAQNLLTGFPLKIHNCCVFSAFHSHVDELAGAMALHVREVVQWRAVNRYTVDRSAARHGRSLGPAHPTHHSGAERADTPQTIGGVERGTTV